MHPRAPDNSADARLLDTTEVKLERLPRAGARFILQPDAEALAELIRDLDLLGLRKVRFEGRLSPSGAQDWELSARIGATVVQPCAVTLEPVITRIDEDVTRRYLADWSAPDEDAAEIEMPEDDTAEAIPRLLDLTQVLAESLSLALPLYPRAPDAEFVAASVAEPGTAAMTDEEAKPFAGLAALRNKLANDDDPSGTPDDTTS